METPEQIFRRVFRELKPNSKVFEVAVEFCQFANANSFISLVEGRLAIRVTDVLEKAPGFILEALAQLLISKLTNQRARKVYRERYRRYLNRNETRQALDRLRQMRGRKVLCVPQGEYYDLQAIFENLNSQFFHSLMAKPNLGWSRRFARRSLGHYDPALNVIVLSRFLDRPEIPRLAIDYVMFHEMLHLRHPTKHHGSRRCVHTAEFKKAEKEFPNWRQALELLRQL